MTASMIVFAMLLLALLAVARFGHPNGPLPAQAPAMRARRDGAPAAPRQGPTCLPRSAPPLLQMLEWIDVPPPLALDAAQARVRDRYIAARFPSVMSGAADLAEPAKVIEAARLYLEERKFDRAHELLQLAIEVSPRMAPLRLAQLEIAFLKRDGPRFLEGSRALHEAIADCPEWAEVQRLGRALLPGETLFGATPARRGNEHYGPWPEMPNWIGASWDLTAEYRAADFHNAMSRSNGRHVPAQLRAA
jgi:hypothetical protein